MRMEIPNNIILIAKKYKLLVAYIVIIAIIIIYPLTYTMFSDIAGAEVALSASEETRNIALWLFDNVFVPVLSVTFLLILLVLATRRRIEVVKHKKNIKNNTKKTVAVILIFVLIAGAFHTTTNFAQERTKPIANKAIIITFDGTRYDKFWSTDHWITQHRDEGAWAEKIIGTYPTVTYPNHISIFTGTWPQIHGCELGPNYAASKGYLFLRDVKKPASEDIFSVANEYGFVTVAIVAPTLLASYLGAKKVITGLTSEPAMEEAIKFLKENKVDIEEKGLVMFIHLVDTDEAMHERSTDSIEYESAIIKEANLVGELIQNITALGWENDTIIFVTADHGGIGYGHFNRYPPLVDEVPLWVWGGPIKKGQKIDGGRLIDIAPTISFALGIRKPRDAVGVVLYRLFKEEVLNEKGITDINSVAVEEYKSSIMRAYIDIVLYFWLATTILFAAIFTIGILLKYRKELRKVVSDFSSQT